ncbi:MAG: MarR family transcriptional regulator [Terracoccus sp.]
MGAVRRAADRATGPVDLDEKRDEQAVSAYVERFGNTLTEAGMPRLAARVFAQLLADDDGRMTAAELTDSLEVSPAAVSGAVRYLTQVSMIGKERERGSRRDVYVVHTDAWHEAIMNRDHLMGQLASGMQLGVQAVGGMQTEPGQRLRLSIEFLDFVSGSMATMSREWEQRKADIVAAWPPA